MKKSVVRIILVFIFLFITVLFSKAQTWSWVKSGDGLGGNEGYAVATDASGNVFLTGCFTSTTITFGTYTLTNIGSYWAVFLVKYDSNGNVLWAKNSICSGCYSDNNSMGVSVDNNGNAYIIGRSNSTITFGTYTITNSGNYDMFIAKFDTNGNVLWAKSAGGTGADVATGISVDGSGNVFVSGYFYSSSISFGVYTLSNSGSYNVFLTKYDSNGNVIWAKSSIGISGDAALSVSADQSGNVFITGAFTSPQVTFGTYTITNSGNADVFITKYDNNGNILWAKSAGSGGNECANGISSDINGNAYVTGWFKNPILSFGTYTLSNSGIGNNEVFITKYDGNGNVVWARNAGATAYCQGWSVSTYTSGVFVVGSFTNTISFGTKTITSAPGSIDPMFIVQYDLSGNVICADALSSGGDDQNGVCANKYGSAYVASDFEINPFVVGSNTLSLTGGEDVFIAKFNCQPNGVKEISNTNKFTKISPNPNNGSFKLQIDDEILNGEIIIYNSLGKKVHEQKISQGENNIVTNDLARGLYHYILLQNNLQINNGKIAVE